MGGGRRQPEIQYIQPPQYQGPPPETEADRQFKMQQQQQMDTLSRSYQQNLDAMRQQSAAQAANSNSVMQTLQQSMARQQEDAVSTRGQLEQARAASQSQLDMLESVRNKSATQTSEMNQQGLQAAGSMMGRMSRRRSARETRY